MLQAAPAKLAGPLISNVRHQGNSSCASKLFKRGLSPRHLARLTLILPPIERGINGAVPYAGHRKCMAGYIEGRTAY